MLERYAKMEELEQKLQYHFKDQRYLKTALTHSSYANEYHSPGGSNERLEFLGDSILGLVVADYLYRTYPNLPEGDLTKKRLSARQHAAAFPGRSA